MISIINCVFWLAMNTPVVSLRIIADVFEFDFWDRLKELEGTFSKHA